MNRPSTAPLVFATVVTTSILLAAMLAPGGAARAQLQGPSPRLAGLERSRPWQRAVWAYEQRAYPIGRTPDDARQAIARDTETFRRASRRRATGTWASLGPTPLQSGGSQFSGRVADIAIDPQQSKHWLIGGAQGGIWETTDSGKSWSARTDDQASLATGAIAFAPGNPDVVYAGTGEAVFSGDSYGGSGILRSNNGGKTWSPVAGDSLVGLAFSDLAVDPADEQTLVAATTWGRFGTAFRFGDLDWGILRSTDGGATWTQALDGVATDLEVDPGDFDRQYGALGDIFADDTNGVYRSTSAGTAWTKVSGPWDGSLIGRIEMALAPSDPDVLYVSVSASTDGTIGALIGLWKTENAWAGTPTWSEIDLVSRAGDYCTPPDRSDGQCWYDHELVIDPKNPDVLYAGGVEVWKWSAGAWSEITPSHVDQHTMAWAGATLVLGNDGGVFSTRNGGDSWSEHNDGLSLIQYYHGSVYQAATRAGGGAAPGIVLGGAQDNGTQLRTTSDTWLHIFGGDGADNLLSASDPTRMWALSTQNLGIRRTLDGGGSFQTVTSGIDRDDNAPFIGVFTQCPADDDIMIAGGETTGYRTDAFFSAASPTWRTQGKITATSDRVAAVAFAPSDRSCKTYAMGTRRGDIYVIRNGRSFRNADKRNGVPERSITDLAFDPEERDTLYLVLSGFEEGTPGEPGHVFRSTNARKGKPTWVDISPDVDVPVNAIVIQPGDSSTVWIGTDLGIYEQVAFGDTIEWVHHGTEEGLPNAAVFDLAATESYVVAFTHGRGAWALDTTASRTPRR